MKSTSRVIPKSQTLALIGGTLLLVICAGVLLVGWRLGLLATTDGGPQTAEVNSSVAPASESSVNGEAGSAPVDNAVLLRRLEQCRPECAGVDLAHINLWQNPLGLNAVNLQGANLSGANLPHHALGGDLSGANLSGVNLDVADLKWTNFTGANLSGARLTWAILSGANLTDADLTGTNLNKAMYDKNTIWPAGFDPEAAGAHYVGLR
ncbi:MAG: pentapeptide repeat-containing protein [Anaerolineae bacterium]|nr:pentapeptide repeat-containing protein [Anaerolineae bacterium]